MTDASKPSTGTFRLNGNLWKLLAVLLAGFAGGQSIPMMSQDKALGYQFREMEEDLRALKRFAEQSRFTGVDGIQTIRCVRALNANLLSALDGSMSASHVHHWTAKDAAMIEDCDEELKILADNLRAASTGKRTLGR